MKYQEPKSGDLFINKEGIEAIVVRYDFILNKVQLRPNKFNKEINNLLGQDMMLFWDKAFEQEWTLIQKKTLTPDLIQEGYANSKGFETFYELLMSEDKKSIEYHVQQVQMICANEKLEEVKNSCSSKGFITKDVINELMYFI